MMKFLTCSCGDRWADVAPFVLRVVTGLIFAAHGWQKLQSGVDPIAAMLGNMGFPVPVLFAIILIAVELVGGIALILGAFTHWVSKLLAIVAFVAMVLVHLKNGFFASNGGYEFVLLLLAATISLMITGAGRWSLDYKLWKK